MQQVPGCVRLVFGPARLPFVSRDPALPMCRGKRRRLRNAVQHYKTLSARPSQTAAPAHGAAGPTLTRHRRVRIDQEYPHIRVISLHVLVESSSQIADGRLRPLKARASQPRDELAHRAPARRAALERFPEVLPRPPERRHGRPLAGVPGTPREGRGRAGGSGQGRAGGQGRAARVARPQAHHSHGAQRH
jgi:hypothetical protein